MYNFCNKNINKLLFLEYNNESSSSSGFYGFNETEFKIFIKEINDQRDIVECDFIHFVKSYFGSLSDNWFSPKAVAFSETYYNKLADSYITIDRALIDLIKGVVHAYNIWAVANNVPKLTDYDYYEDINFIEPCFLEPEEVLLKTTNPNGAVGMNVNNVKSATSLFISNMVQVANQIDETPSLKGFYDPGDSQALAYTEHLNIMKNSINTILDELEIAINSAIEEEGSSVIASVTASSEVLSTNQVNQY